MSVRKEVTMLTDQVGRIQDTIKKIQEECPHETSVYSPQGSSGNWDRDDSYWYNHYCYDCRKRWTTEQGRGNESNMKVCEIDYNKKPEIIELELKIESMR